MQGVLDGLALAQELGVPDELGRDARRAAASRDDLAQPCRGADRDGRLADDQAVVA